VTSQEAIRTLYICYFGVREPLVQTQVLPYLRQLSAGGVRVHLLTFEPDLRSAWTPEQLKEQRDSMASDGINWFALPYHKRPSVPATFYDIVKGAWFVRRLVRRHRIDVLHARSHVPMMMAMLAQRGTSCRLVFDFRGLVADEYVDAGLWQEGSLRFRALKAVERAGLRRADQVIVLTERMRDWLVEQRLVDAEKIQVIPCCVDFSRFPEERAAEAVAQTFEVVYAGAAIGLYLLKEMGHFFMALRVRVPGAFFRILTTSPVVEVEAALRQAGLEQRDFWIGSVSPQNVAKYLRQARLGLSFRKATFAQIAASPTKIPEYLAAGLPTVSSAGIGDTDDLLERERVGVVLNGFEDEDYREAVDRILDLLADPDLKSRCARTAHRYFDLVVVGGARYHKVYQRIAEGQPRGSIKNAGA
jgi:glycosyltransferase involved in cell wall biosynthesis